MRCARPVLLALVILVASAAGVQGQAARACAILRDIVDTPTWQAFGAIAAEAELVRGACRTP